MFIAFVISLLVFLVLVMSLWFYSLKDPMLDSKKSETYRMVVWANLIYVPVAVIFWIVLIVTSLLS